MVAASAMAGCASPPEAEAGAESAFEQVDDGSTSQGTVTPTPESAKAPSAQLSPAEMEALLLRKEEMRERAAKRFSNNPPGSPGPPDEPVPETTVSRPFPSE